MPEKVSKQLLSGLTVTAAASLLFFIAFSVRLQQEKQPVLCYRGNQLHSADDV